MNRLRFLIFATSAALSAHAQASDWFEQNRFEVFVSQSLVHSSDYNFLSQSDDDLSFDLWEAGALYSTKVYKELGFSGQLLGRKVSEASGDDIRVDYAFFSLPLYRQDEVQLVGRLGRIRSSFGFYNETRDIPHTRTGIFMPQSIYYDQTRNSFYSADGIEFFVSKGFDEKQLSFQVFVSKPVIDEEEIKEASALNPSNLEGDKSLLVKLAYGSEFQGWRAALTYYRPEYTIDVNPVLAISPSVFGLLGGTAANIQAYGDDSSFYSETVLTSLEYNQLDWSVTAEYSRHKFKSNVNLDLNKTVANSPFLQTLSNSQLSQAEQYAKQNIKYLGHEESFYIQGLYRWTDTTDTYIRYDYNRLRDVSFADPYGHFVDMNIGASWRPDNSWLIRGEFHYIDGWSRLFNRDNDTPRTNRYWNVAALQVAYRW